MPRIAATYVTLLYEHLRERGVDPVALFGEAAPEAGDFGVGRWPGERWRAMLELASRTTGEAAFGVQVARRLRARHMGLLGYLLLSCRNLMDALQRIERFHLLASEMNPMEVRREQGQLLLRWPLQHGWAGQLWDEFGLACVVQFTRELTGRDGHPDRVDFVGPEPADRAPYVEFFGENLRFGQPLPQLLSPLSMLDEPLRAPDVGMLELLDRQAEQLLHRIAPGPAALRPLREQLLHAMRAGEPTLDALARRMGKSPRSLQRELARHDTRFQAVLAELRRGLATEYLRDPRLELTDIADLLGYADQSTFTRAFLQWTGETPGQWRRVRS